MRCLWLAGLLLLARPAVAQVADDAQGELLHVEASRLLDEGKLDQACPKFDESYRASLRIAHLIDAADCYERAGKTASAWARYGAASGAAERYGEEDVGRVVEERRARLEPNLTLLMVEVSAEVRATPGLVIKVNGSLVDPTAIGLAVPVDPGTVLVDAEAPSRIPFRSVLTAAGPGQLRVRVEKLDSRLEQAREPVTETGTVVPVAPRPSSTQPAEKTNVQRTVGYAVGGAGVVGLVLGVVFNLKARSAADDANALCLSGQPAGSPCTVSTPSQARAREENVRAAESSSTASYVLFGVGAAALATGGVLVLTAGGGEHGTPSRLSASFSDRHIGLTLGGSL